MVSTGRRVTRFGAVVAVSVAAALVVVGAAVVVVTGVFSTTTTTHPPCDELPTRQQVATALAAHRDLADRLESLGPGVSVAVGSPCGGGLADRALVDVRYASADERRAIDRALTEADGFDAPVAVSERDGALRRGGLFSGEDQRLTRW